MESAYVSSGTNLPESQQVVVVMIPGGPNFTFQPSKCYLYTIFVISILHIIFGLIFISGQLALIIGIETALEIAQTGIVCGVGAFILGILGLLLYIKKTKSVCVRMSFLILCTIEGLYVCGIIVLAPIDLIITSLSGEGYNSCEENPYCPYGSGEIVNGMFMIVGFLELVNIIMSISLVSFAICRCCRNCCQSCCMCMFANDKQHSIMQSEVVPTVIQNTNDNAYSITKN